MTQLELATHDVDPHANLSDRQRIALAHIAAHPPVTNAELGAVLHEDRQARGKRGHHRNDRCDWCTPEGRQIADGLKAAGLIAYRRGLGWALPDWKPPTATDSGYDPATAEIPF